MDGQHRLTQAAIHVDLRCSDPTARLSKHGLHSTAFGRGGGEGGGEGGGAPSSN
jgi:hypothetical protein